MRRRDREIIAINEIVKIIEQCDCCRIALIDGNKPYIIPLNFGLIHNNQETTFYFHGAREGRKMDLIKKNPLAGFELDTSHQLTSEEEACSYSFLYQSVIGSGTISVVEDETERSLGLNAIMKQYTGKSDWNFDSKVFGATAILKLEVVEISGKQHIQKKENHQE